MTYQPIVGPTEAQSSTNLLAPWSWCAQCQRVYPTGTHRIVRFNADGLHPHPTALKLCPYADCRADVNHHGWQWATIRREHADYPITPKRDVKYLR